MHPFDLDTILALLRTQAFVCTWSGRRVRADENDEERPRRMVLRSSVQNDSTFLILSSFTQKQHRQKTLEFSDETLTDLVQDCLTHDFLQLHIQRPDGDFYFKRARKSVLQRKTKASIRDWQSEQSHDHEKRQHISEEKSSKLLKVLGLSDDSGQLIPARRAKFRQINHFIGLALGLEALEADHIHIVDCGCGRAYLSLALYHVLHEQMNKQVQLVGIDSNPVLIAECNEMASALGFSGARFVCSGIAEYTPDSTPDLVIALHACDTATDDALALALKSDAGAILAAPCCHHYVNEQLRRNSAPEATQLLLRDGISRERLSDLLTDSMRRDIVRSFGYRAELMEFIAQEHTMKNIMLRAERTETTEQQRSKARDEVIHARTMWHVAPKLAEIMLSDTVQTAEPAADTSSMV